MSSGRRLVGAALVAVGLAACAVILLSGSRGYEVTAVLADAGGLRENYSVRIDGATVGRVVELRVDAEDRVRARLALDEQIAPLGRSARAFVRSANLFGEKFVELEPGDRDEAAPDGWTIPLERTATPVELDEVLDVLDEDTRSALSALLNEAGVTLAGREADLNAVLRELPGGLDQGRRLVGELARDNKAIGSLLERSDRVVAAIARERHGLVRLIEAANEAFAPFAERHSELGHSVEQGALTLAELRRTLERVESLAVPLGPAAGELERTAPHLARTLRALGPFQRAASPALRAALRAAPEASKLGEAATPVVASLPSTAGELQRFAAALGGVSSLLEDSFPDVLGLMEGWARAIQTRDGLGHVFRVNATVSEELLKALVRDPEEARRLLRRGEHRRRVGRSAQQGARPRPGSGGEKGPIGARLPGLPELSDLGGLADQGAREASPSRANAQRDLERLLDFLVTP